MMTTDLTAVANGRTTYTQLGLQFERAHGNTLWVKMRRDPVQAVLNYSFPLLREMHDMVTSVKEANAHWNHEGTLFPIEYAVMCSDHPEYFNLGGDLKFIRHCLKQRDRHLLREYALLGLEVMREWTQCGSRTMTTIALVQGKALGGGFETAMGADYLIAEEHSVFGFPEVLFGLFPFTGALQLLSSHVGVHQAERMITNARIYTAAELQEMGIVDLVCPKGKGRQAARDFIEGHAKRRRPRLVVQRCRHRMMDLDEEVMLAIVEEWVELAMNMRLEEARALDMLIMMQGKGDRSLPSLVAV